MECTCKKCGNLLFKVVDCKPEISCGAVVGHVEVEAVCPCAMMSIELRFLFELKHMICV